MAISFESWKCLARCPSATLNLDMGSSASMASHSSWSLIRTPRYRCPEKNRLSRIGGSCDDWQTAIPWPMGGLPHLTLRQPIAKRRRPTIYEKNRGGSDPIKKIDISNKVEKLSALLWFVRAKRQDRRKRGAYESDYWVACGTTDGGRPAGACCGGASRADRHRGHARQGRRAQQQAHRALRPGAGKPRLARRQSRHAVVRESEL